VDDQSLSASEWFPSLADWNECVDEDDDALLGLFIDAMVCVFVGEVLCNEC